MDAGDAVVRGSRDSVLAVLVTFEERPSASVVAASTPTPDGSETIVQEPDTALGDCVTLLEPVAERELTANGERARDVVVDVVDYGQF
ncbi:hypothetical protein [Halobaculum sp. MBLA0143]|uniref:hypothetical protein n=1 Tax=Halobaculum sp. MBLA0143 TaxID=3079933 RepID=UPI003523FC20